MTKPDPITMTVNFADIINRMSDETLAIIAPPIMDDLINNKAQRLAKLADKLSPHIVELLLERVQQYMAEHEDEGTQP